jgi:hypothetical protein
VIEQGQDGPRLLQEHGARRGQPYPLTAALQQWRAHHLLKAPDLLAQRRLSDEHPLRGVRGRASVGDRHKIAQMTQLDTRQSHALRTRQHNRFCLCQPYRSLPHPGHPHHPARALAQPRTGQPGEASVRLGRLGHWNARVACIRFWSTMPAPDTSVAFMVT